MQPHTPGPWSQAHRKQPDGNYVTQVFDASGETIADLTWFPVETPEAIETSREANARLIAAAPTMLLVLTEVEAIMTLVAPRNDKHDYHAVLAHVRRVIAMARSDETNVNK